MHRVIRSIRSVHSIDVASNIYVRYLSVKQRNLSSLSSSSGGITCWSNIAGASSSNECHKEFLRLKNSSYHYHNARFYTSTSVLLDHVDAKNLPVKILYASQGGTAQIFAMQLAEALEEIPGGDKRDVTVQGLHEGFPPSLLGVDGNDNSEDNAAVHIFLTATAGVGEPPDNARQFYEWLMNQSSSNDFEKVQYTVFGLGNQKAHPNHYNVVGKALDAKLNELGANRIYPLGLGDDGECIEDDYDTWMEDFLETVYRSSNDGVSISSAEDSMPVQEEEEKASAVDEEKVTLPTESGAAATTEDSGVILASCAGAKDKSGKRAVSSKYGRLKLAPSSTDVVRDNMMQLSASDTGSKPFYSPQTQPLQVLSNRPLNTQAGENGLYEMRVSLTSNNPKERLTYETGDHLMVYPQNSEAIVTGFLQQFDVDPHATIHPPETPGKHPYPHPTGITLTETLRHCVELTAAPSPAFARHILGRPKLDYKNEIAKPHRTVLDLMAEAGRQFALEEILYNLPPMKARYYSIASSNLVHPDEIYLVYRPVQYTSPRGNLHVGVCTNYMKSMMGAEDAALDDCNSVENASSQLFGVVNSNPSFRLPADEKTPTLFIAGGCGVAPIRAFLEERIHVASKHKHNPYSEGYLFLGFRSPGDAPYKSLVQRAFQCGVISNVHLTYSTGCGEGANTKLFGEELLRAHTSCGLVSDAVGKYGEELYSFFERGGHTYICGGARLFGVAIENEVHLLLQKHGNLSENEATEYLQGLLEAGKFHEDLSD